LTHYAIDGIWHNSIGVGGICHCDNCKASWYRFSGKEMPTQDSSSELQDVYMQWKSMVADEHMAVMKNTVKSFGDDKVYTAEIFSMFETGQRIHSGIDLYNARDHFDFMVSVAFLTENSDRIHYEDLSYAGTIIRFLKSIAPQKEAIILYGENGTAHRYVMDPSEDLKVWLWQAQAAGGRFWNCNFTGMHPDATHDRRNAFNNIPAYRFVKENHAYLENQNPWAQIGIYYSKSTRQFYRSIPEEGDSFGGSVKGMISVMNEHHIPFDFLADDDLDIEKLSKYKLVILSNVRCMSERECEIIEVFVRNGGTLLATYASSLYTENGKMREDLHWPNYSDAVLAEKNGTPAKTTISILWIPFILW
jgi:hypothetical protein